jgi:glycosyltransferase involved in cell wall biosynthesis
MKAPASPPPERRSIAGAAPHSVPAADAPAGPTLSIVVPMYNEAANVDRLFARLVPAVERLGLSFEIVCVDDGSRDRTRDMLIAARSRDPRVKIVALSRNFGKEIALAAGIRYASGAAVVPIDADLQHPPEVIGQFVEKWREGYEVVYAVRRSRGGEPWPRRIFARAFYWVFDRLSSTTIPREAGDFRLLDRRVVDVLNLMPERSRFMKGLFAWVGFRQIGIMYDVERRQGGASTFNLRALARFAFTGISAFSNVPLTIAGYAGAVIAIVALLSGAYFILEAMVLGIDVPGYPSLIVTILFFGGVQLLTLGIIGSYLGRVYEEVKRRPLYVVAETHGLGEQQDAAGVDQRRAASG